MDLSDDIAYSVHDFEDAIVNGYLDPAPQLSDPRSTRRSLDAIQAWVGYDFTRDELADALVPPRFACRCGSPSFDGSRAASRASRTSRPTSSAASPARRPRRRARRIRQPALTRYRAHVVVPRVIEAEIAVLKGIIGAAVVSIEGRKPLYKEQRRVLKRLADALWDSGPDALDPVFAEDFAAADDGCRAQARDRRPGREPHRPARPRLARPPRRRGGSGERRHLGPGHPRRRRGARRPSRRGALMAGRIRQADVDEVKARTNIADIVGERVALKSAGVGSLKGLCPFHDERSPSFHVRPQVGLLPLLRLRRIGRRLLVPARRWTTSASPRPSSASPAASATRCTTRTAGAAPETQRPHAAVRRERGGRGVLPRAARDRRRPTRRGGSSASAASTPAPPRISASASRRRAGTRMLNALTRAGLHASRS